MNIIEIGRDKEYKEKICPDLYNAFTEFSLTRNKTLVEEVEKRIELATYIKSFHKKIN